MSRSLWSQLSRNLYLASRAAGDVNAAQHGRLGDRLAKRYWHRLVVNTLRKGRMW